MKKLRYYWLISIEGKWIKLSNTLPLKDNSTMKKDVHFSVHDYLKNLYS